MSGNNKYELEYVDCPLCGCNKYKIYIKNAKELYNGFNELFDVVKCNRCEFIYTNPRPTKETISYFYPDNAGYYKPQVALTEKKNDLKYKFFNSILKYKYHYPLKTNTPKFFALLLGTLFKHRLDCAHIPSYKKNGVLLDIGCSWGNYLKKMYNLGWQVYGTEINSKACQFAKNELDLNNIYNGFFEDFSWGDNFFDVVHMSMVLEHLYEPNLILKKIHRCLKPNGLLIFSVPDISGFEAKLYKHYCYTLHVPQHLNHFSTKTITRFLSQNGFQILKIKHHNFDRDLVASAGYGKHRIIAKIFHNKVIRKTLIKSFVYLLSRFGKTSRMSIYVEKIL